MRKFEIEERYDGFELQIWDGGRMVDSYLYGGERETARREAEQGKRLYERDEEALLAARALGFLAEGHPADDLERVVYRALQEMLEDVAAGNQQLAWVIQTIEGGLHNELLITPPQTARVGVSEDQEERRQRLYRRYLEAIKAGDALLLEPL